MREIVFALPSYGRSDLIVPKTLTTLKRLEVPKEKTFIFVANEEEEKKYTEATRGWDIQIVVGNLGLGEQRTFINAYFPEGTGIVQMDDDLEVIRKNGTKVVLLDTPLMDVAQKAFDMCDELGVKMWGVTNTANGFFMRHQVVHGLRGMCGALFGEYSQLPDLQSQWNPCEDLHKIFMHYQKYGGVLRIDDIGLDQVRNAEGGVAEHLGGVQGRLDRYVVEITKMIEMYPDLVAGKNWDNPKKGLTRVKNKTHNRYPSILGLS